MKSNDEILLIEETRDWRGAVYFLEKNEADDLRAYLRMTFVLLDFLADGQYVEEEEDFVFPKIKYFFDKANLKHSDNSEFLFFLGIMIYIGEWYFGMDNVDQAKSMLEKAKDIDPNNVLYEWGYYSRTDQRLEVNTDLKYELSGRVLNDSLIIDDLKGLGLLGVYVHGILEYTYEGLKELKGV